MDILSLFNLFSHLVAVSAVSLINSQTRVKNLKLLYSQELWGCLRLIPTYFKKSNFTGKNSG